MDSFVAQSVKMSLKIHFLFKESFGFLSFGLGKDLTMGMVKDFIK